MDAIVLWPTNTVSLSLTGENGSVEITEPTETLVLALTPLVGGSGVSGPDIYAFAAAQG